MAKGIEDLTLGEYADRDVLNPQFEDPGEKLSSSNEAKISLADLNDEIEEITKPTYENL